jgi:hypothetical protein
MALCPAAEFPRLPASETAYRLARNRGRFLVQRQRLQRGKPFNVSSEHHIVGTQGNGGDAADARSSRQSAARMCSGGVPPYRTRVRHVLEILLASTHAIAARPVSGCPPHGLHDSRRIPPPGRWPFDLDAERFGSLLGLEPTRSRLACLRSSTSACEPMLL